MIEYNTKKNTVTGTVEEVAEFIRLLKGRLDVVVNDSRRKWTTEATARLKELYLQQVASKQIAKILHEEGLFIGVTYVQVDNFTVRLRRQGKLNIDR